jgi:hypothetical protein
MCTLWRCILLVITSKWLNIGVGLMLPTRAILQPALCSLADIGTLLLLKLVGQCLLAAVAGLCF